MGEGSVAEAGKVDDEMNAETIGIVISVVTVGVAIGALTMAGFRQLRQDMESRFSESRKYT